MRLDEARRVVAQEVDSIQTDLSRSLIGRSLHPGIALLLIGGAAMGFWWGERRVAALRQQRGGLPSRRAP